jgi:hypothetical protein
LPSFTSPHTVVQTELFNPHRPKLHEKRAEKRAGRKGEETQVQIQRDVLAESRKWLISDQQAVLLEKWHDYFGD